MSLRNFYLIILLAFVANFNLMTSAQPIIFEAINENNGEIMQLDSIVIINKTTNKSTTLIGEYSFDPFSSTAVEDSPVIKSNIINRQMDGKLYINPEYVDFYFNIFSSTGKLVYTSEGSKYSPEIDINNLSLGLYLIQAVSIGNTVHEKFIKINDLHKSLIFTKYVFLSAELFDFYAFRSGFETAIITDVEPIPGTKYTFSMLQNTSAFYDSIRFEISGINIKGSIKHEWTVNGSYNINYTTEVRDYSADFLTIDSELRSLDNGCVQKIYNHVENPPKFECQNYYYDNRDSVYFCELRCNPGSWSSSIYSSNVRIFFDFNNNEINQITINNLKASNEQSGNQPPYNKAIYKLSITLSGLPFTEINDQIIVEVSGKQISDYIRSFNAQTYTAATYMAPPYDYQHYNRDYFKIEEVSDFAKLKITIYKHSE